MKKSARSAKSEMSIIMYRSGSMFISPVIFVLFKPKSAMVGRAAAESGKRFQ